MGPRFFPPVAVQVWFGQEILINAELSQRLLHALAILDVEQSGKLREAFGQPLVVVTLPTDALAPPLMRTFVGTKEVRNLSLVLETDGVSLGGVQKSKPS